MSTRANVVIEYRDWETGMPSQLWLSHHHDGNVQGIGEMILHAVWACGLIWDSEGLKQLWDEFPREFENMTGLEEDIEFYIGLRAHGTN